MPSFDRSFEVAASLEAVRGFHGSPEALRTLTPPPVIVRLESFGPMEEGMEAVFTLFVGPLPIRWRARHENVGSDGFDDVQVEGPMKAWRHRHRFHAQGPERTLIMDHIEYQHRSGFLGVWTRCMFGRPALATTFRYRAWATRKALEKPGP
ncbi:MAG: cyclase [Myxococcota bacterium]